MDKNNENEKVSDANIYTRRKMLGITAGGLAGSALFGTTDAEAKNGSVVEKPVKRFDGKIAVITGVARGMGRSHAVGLAREGATIVGCDILESLKSLDYELATADDMKETERLVTEAGGKFIGIKADVRNSAAAKGVIDRAVKEFGRVDLLLANAGIYGMSSIAKMTDEQFDDVIKTNVYGVFNITRAALGPMTDKNYGRIVITSSAAGRMGLANIGHYAASKWAVIGLAKSIALEVAKQGITVNCVCPTGVNTPIMNNPAAWRRAFPDDPNPTREKFEARMNANPFTPQGIPWLMPQDVTDAALFLLSDEAKHITGSALDVSAGSAASWSA